MINLFYITSRIINLLSGQPDMEAIVQQRFDDWKSPSATIVMSESYDKKQKTPPDLNIMLSSDLSNLEAALNHMDWTGHRDVSVPIIGSTIPGHHVTFDLLYRQNENPELNVGFVGIVQSGNSSEKSTIEQKMGGLYEIYDVSASISENANMIIKKATGNEVDIHSFIFNKYIDEIQSRGYIGEGPATMNIGGVDIYADMIFRQNVNNFSAPYVLVAKNEDETIKNIVEGDGGMYISLVENDYIDLEAAVDRFENLANNPTVSVDETNFPKGYKLSQNFPNPCNPSTKIRYQIAESCDVTIDLFDLLGRKVTSYMDGLEHKPGMYEVDFDVSGLSSGHYFYQIRAGRFTDTKKMEILK